MMNVSQIDKECTGCMVCVHVCPVHCISSYFDDEGFLSVCVNEEKCINCGKCYNVCSAMRHFDDTHKDTKVAYAATINDTNMLMNSSSGGVAALLSSEVVRSGGVAYGAIFDEVHQVVHARISKLSDLFKLSGSKYVQSNISDVYHCIKDDCEAGIPVVFFGTPCQVYAIRRFLEREYGNLLLVDIVCHGVPSPVLFSKYLDYEKEQMKSHSIIRYGFREKRVHGWGNVRLIQTESKITCAEWFKDPYYYSFQYAMNFRESCYLCKFSNESRVGDITLGDYWGIETEHKEYAVDTNLGVSAVICNTQKGKEAFDKLKTKLYYVQSSVESIAKNNANMVCSSKRHPIRDSYYKNIEKYGIRWTKRMMYMDYRYYCYWIKSIIPYRIKRILKDFLRGFLR